MTPDIQYTPLDDPDDYEAADEAAGRLMWIAASALVTLVCLWAGA